jgi:hypothetical protein
MKAFDQGCVIRVTVSAAEVYAFSRQWPCFGDSRALSFTFDKRNGDLVDIHGDHGMDESGVSALADDARDYGIKRLNLEAVSVSR